MNKVKTQEQEYSKNPKDELLRRRILESAKALFIEHGVENVNMHQIAKMAEVGQASLYRRYKEKGDVCMDIVREECQPLFDEVKANLVQATADSSLERFYRVIVIFVAFLETKSPWLCAINRATPGYRPLQSPLFKWMRDTCRNLLNEAIQEEEIAAETDVLYTVEILLSALQNIDFHAQDQSFGTERILQGLRQIFIEGLKK